ncbi:ImpA family metalloprotease [Photobacterium sp. 53610]|uniref:ImpA family metalloprotease n=1 Tax=Photobacterium sp. 53610 TaxID=3102789 RepID=UPI002ED868BB
MKKLSSILLCLSLAACGGGGDTKNDGQNASGANLPLDPINAAVKLGDPRLLPSDSAALEQRIATIISKEHSSLASLQSQIFGQNTIQYDPGRNSRYFSLKHLTSAKELITGNQGYPLVTLRDAKERRSVAFGTNILRELDAGSHGDFASNMQKIIDWLLVPALSTGRSDLKVSFTLLSSSHFNQSKNWLQSRYPNLTFTLCEDEAQLSDCLSQADLIITGTSGSFSEHSVTTALDAAAARKRAMLYVHTNSWNSTPLTNPVLSYFGVQTQAVGGAGNYFTQDKANWSSAAEMRDQTGSLSGIETLIARLRDNSFSFHIADCEDDNNSCDNLPAFGTEFLTPAESLRAIVRNVDESATDIFTLPDDYTLEKHLILLADQYRKNVRFPMSKNSTPTLTFLRSYFADHLVYNTRQINPVQPDLGNFSRTDFSHVSPAEQTVTLTSRTPWRAAGVYALPGQTLTVTRTDPHSDVAARIFINTQRATSTKPMAPNDGYNRPKFLQSHPVTIQAGETIHLTSPYGGPVQVGFTDKGTEMTFAFRQIGQHPYWKPGENDAAFITAVNNNAYDWAEVATEHFEIHSRNSRMQTTLSENSRWDTPGEMATFIQTYHHSALRALAGYHGENITPISEVDSFAAAHTLNIPEWDQVQHMNADQPTCGYGCSGNPYDAGWAFSVLGHGDLHEVGHNVESGRFKFNGFEGHATTNFYSYYAKSLATVNEPGYEHQCQSLPFDTILADIQQSQLETDPAAYMAGRGYSSWSQGAALVVEMMMHAQDKGALSNGWHLIPRLHLLDKAFSDADNDDASWDATKASLGFSTYSRAEAGTLSNNDWLLIAASYATGLDYRPYLDLLGLNYSSKAGSQVAAFGNTAVDKAFFKPASNSAYCDSLNQPKTFF